MEEKGAFEIAVGTGPVVQAVLILLIFASVLSWGIIVAKWVSFRIARKENNKFLNLFWNAKSLDSIFNSTKDYSHSPVSNVFRAGYLEFQKVSNKVTTKENKENNRLFSEGMENVSRALRRASLGEILRLEKFVPYLASIASVAPFVGLFGTVWGIMNSFSALGQGGPATLQRVAPGISEALIATAVGLAAAIPAVIAYNQSSTRMRTFRADMDSFASDFVNILKRNYLG